MNFFLISILIITVNCASNHSICKDAHKQSIVDILKVYQEEELHYNLSFLAYYHALTHLQKYPPSQGDSLQLLAYISTTLELDNRLELLACFVINNDILMESNLIFEEERAATLLLDHPLNRSQVTRSKALKYSRPQTKYYFPLPKFQRSSFLDAIIVNLPLNSSGIFRNNSLGISFRSNFFVVSSELGLAKRPSSTNNPSEMILNWLTTEDAHAIAAVHNEQRNRLRICVWGDSPWFPLILRRISSSIAMVESFVASYTSVDLPCDQEYYIALIPYFLLGRVYFGMSFHLSDDSLNELFYFLDSYVGLNSVFAMFRWMPV